MVSSISLYKILLTILNKNNSEYISPEEFIQLLVMSSDDMYNDYLGRKTARRSVYGHNSITDGRLAPFREKSPVLPYNASVPTINVPKNCRHIRSVTDNFGAGAVYQDDNRFNMLRKDTNVDLKRTVYYKEEASKKLEILTEKPVSSFTLEYLRDPSVPTLPYTIVDREMVFDESTAVNLEWDSDQTSNLLNRLMVYAGVVVDDNTVLQIGRINKSEE